MSILFPDLDPYETLNISKEATAQDVKKSYRRLCLIYHPDKLKDVDDPEEASLKFEQVQFAHSILSDEKKRKRYDQTGSLEEIDDGEPGFDWFEYFSKVKAEITEESIKLDKLSYQGSDDEEQEIIEAFIESDGDFLNLFEVIPHTEITTEEEKRIFDIVNKLVNEQVLENTPQWKAYKSKRKQLWYKFSKSQEKLVNKEAKEAEDLKKEILKKNNVKSLDHEDNLRQLIQAKRQSSLDSLIGSLEAKYGSKEKKKGGKKRKADEIDEEEFAKIQARLFKDKKK